MTLPATAQAIYDLLVADEAISDRLGTYTLSDGTTLPAISVLAGGANLPAGTVTDGVEITITATPNQAETSLLTFETLLNPTWRIYVIAWGALGELQTVRNRIVALLPGAVSTPMEGEPPGQGLGVMEQVVIRWTNPCEVMTA